ncbi:MAG TPA: hypothetical protein VIH99_07430 [Bdellovibrionota bacterium]|jgi:hypothetical protein
MAKKTEKKRSKAEEYECEDPLLLDDPGGSPLEWIEFELPALYEAVRHIGGGKDPWKREMLAHECEAFTERRRRKLQDLSLGVENDICDQKGESVA